MSLESIGTTGSLAPSGPYSPAIRLTDAPGLIFVSGQLPVDPDSGEIETTEVAEQITVSLQNAFAVLEQAGGSRGDIVKVTLYVTDLSNPGTINAAYADCFEEPYPARSTVEVSRLPKGALAEVELIAAARPAQSDS